MKLRLRANILKDAIESANVAVSKTNQNQQLKGIYFKAEENYLVIRSTNLNIGFEQKLSAEVDKVGEMLLLGEVVVRVLGGITFSENALCSLDFSGSMCVVSVEKHVFEVKALPLDKFPELPVSEGIQFQIPSNSLLHGLKSTTFSVAKTEIKPEISGVYVYVEDGQMTFVGTDSYRLAEKKFSTKDIPNMNFILPEKNCKDVIRLFGEAQGELTVSLSKNSLSLKTLDTIFVTRLIQGNFPNYRQIIPSSSESSVVLLKQDLQKSLRITSFFSDKTEQVVLTSSNEGLEIHAENMDIGKATENIQNTLKGEGFSVKVNSRYLEEFLSNLNETSVILKFNAQNKPLVVQGLQDAFYTYLIMPSYK
jgi:DNA polymerase-3 subunit beta